MTDYYDDLGVGEVPPARLDGWDHRYEQWLRFEIAVRACGIESADAVVDLGCGTGRLSRYLGAGQSGGYVGVDRRTEVVEAAADEFPDAEFVAGDFGDSAVDRCGPFDCAVAIGTMVDGRARDEAERRNRVGELVGRLDELADRTWVLVALNQKRLDADPIRGLESALQGTSCQEITDVLRRRGIDAVVDDQVLPTDVVVAVDRERSPAEVRHRIAGEDCYLAVLNLARRIEGEVDPVGAVRLWLRGGRIERATKALCNVPAGHRRRRLLKRRIELAGG